MRASKPQKSNRTQRPSREERDEAKFFPKKKKWSPYWDGNGAKDIDYKDIKFLSRFVTEKGKILPRKITGLTTRQQRKVTSAVKRARQMGILSYVGYGDGANYERSYERNYDRNYERN